MPRIRVKVSRDSMTDEEKAIRKREKTAKTRLARLNNCASVAKNHVNKIQKAVDQIDKVREGKTTVVDDDVAKILKNKEVIFTPNPGPQTDFLAASEDEVFYGGSRGAAKTYSLLVDPLRYCTNKNHRALLIRRTMPELREIIFHTQQLYSKAYPGAKWREQEKEWLFPSGARIEFGYAENIGDLMRYQGQAYTWIGVDELPQFPTRETWDLLKGSLRSVDPTLPVFMRSSGNPGSVGSGWVKEMFIDPAPPGKPFIVKIQTSDGEKYITRRFIPAKLSDNPYLTKTDSYLKMLSSLPEIKRKQWLEGDWDAFENRAFPEFNRTITPNPHIVEPFFIDRDFPRFRACDWGYSSPACVLWFAVDNDNGLIVYKELYEKGNNAEQFAVKVIEKDGREPINYGVLDASVWQKRGDTGPSIPEVMAKAGCRWRPSDRSKNSRISGKVEIHRRLAVYTGPTGNRTARLRIFNTCTHLIKTLASLLIDDDKPEDVDTKMDDHAYDALRYGCMSRPMGRSQMLDWINFDNKRKETYAPADAVFGY